MRYPDSVRDGAMRPLTTLRLPDNTFFSTDGKVRGGLMGKVEG